MQGSRIQSSRSNWKQAVKKNNPPQSKIFGENRDLPNKFSPAKFNIMENNNAKSLIKNRTNHNYSHDQILLQESRERSKSKQPELRKGQTTNVPQSNKFASQIHVFQKGVDSQKSIDFQLKRNIGNIKSGDIDIVRELKQQFLRFKQKILKELKKQEEQLQKTIKQIYQKIQTMSNFEESPIHFKSSPANSKIHGIFTPHIQTYQSPIYKYLQTINKQISSRIQPVTQLTSKVDKNVIIQQNGSLKIKQRMIRMQQLIIKIKQDLNDQSTEIKNKQYRGQKID